MGGDQLVPALVGRDVDERIGDEIRDARKQLYRELIDEVAPFDGAHDFIADLRNRGHRIVLASSSPEDEVEHYIDLLEARELLDEYTTDEDVEATKPEPDLVRAALDKAGTDDAVLVGDTRWDIDAAARAGLETICVITGGWSEQELRDAGALAVFESVEDLRQRLDETLLA
jgi:HAD superfamily hydrolase (TIGR01509 family)